MNKPLPGAGFPPSGPNSVSTRQSRPPFPLDLFPHREYNELQSQIEYERHDTSKVYADTIRYGVDCRRRFLGHIATAYALLYLPPESVEQDITPDPASSPSQISIVFFRGGGAESFVRPHRIFPGKCGRKKTTDYIFSHAIKAPFAALCKYHRRIPSFPAPKGKRLSFCLGLERGHVLRFFNQRR